MKVQNKINTTDLCSKSSFDLKVGNVLNVNRQHNIKFQSQNNMSRNLNYITTSIGDSVSFGNALINPQTEETFLDLFVPDEQVFKENKKFIFAMMVENPELLFLNEKTRNGSNAIFPSIARHDALFAYHILGELVGFKPEKIERLVTQTTTEGDNTTNILSELVNDDNSDLAIDLIRRFANNCGKQDKLERIILAKDGVFEKLVRQGDWKTSWKVLNHVENPENKNAVVKYITNELKDDAHKYKEEKYPLLLHLCKDEGLNRKLRLGLIDASIESMANCTDSNFLCRDDKIIFDTIQIKLTKEKQKVLDLIEELDLGHKQFKLDFPE